MGELLGVKLKHGSFDLESGDYPITFVLHRLAKRACFAWHRLLGRTPDDGPWAHLSACIGINCPRVLVPSDASMVTKSCRSPSTIHFLAAITLPWLLRIAHHSNAMRPLAPMNFVK